MISSEHFWYRAVLGIAFAAGRLLAQNAPAASPEFFENKIRPILANNCYGCHTSSALGGLRLDSLEAMKKGGKRGAALVPGDVEKSLLIRAIRQSDPELKMPSGGKLKAAEIADLEAWVKAGAAWPASTAVAGAAKNDGVLSAERRNFWSFQALLNPATPAVKDAKWPKTDIDRFVLARLEQDGLHPVVPASKHDLLRRAWLDLTGLLPAPEDYAAFEKDSSAGAFAKVVDRLLASPAYGERWGRIWLDVARFGEDDYRSLNPFPRGYRPYQNAWAYRDWVVQALNDDLPYDKFVTAQLAGDLMDPKVRYKMLPATGFLGLGPWYYDNGSNEVTRADERHDRVDAVTRGFLGLTAQCARCHDHKYDPIPQKDYYALAGVFYNTVYEEYPRAPKKVVDQYTHLEEELDKEKKIQQDVQQGLSNQLSRALALKTSNYLLGVWEVSGKPKKEIARVVDARRLDFETLDRWIKYMAKPTEKYHNKDDWQAMVKNSGGTKEKAQELADRFQKEVLETMLEKNEIDDENRVIEDKDIEGTKPKKRTDKPSNFVSNRDFNPGSWLQLKSLPEQQNAFWTEIFQRELKDSDDPNAMGEMGFRSMKPGVLLFRGWGLESRVGPEAQARLKSIQDDIAATKKKIEPYYPFIHGVKDAPKPEEIKLALRGNPETRGDPVPRHFLSVFSKGEPAPLNQGSGRLQLAKLIVEQPIAMRVIVNRIWKGHFGTGIVDSPSNFGFGGERPTNPALLEHLAQTFVNNGMSIKKLHREIMLSAVYQLSTADNPVALEKDSGNRLYWRANRKRMDAEQVRDTILQVAGNLDDTVGGPSEELTPEFHRRTVYGRVSRYKLDSYLQIFDFPMPSISAEKRFTTTVPLQRLFLMNSDFVQVESEALAKKVAAEADNRARIRKLYALVYGRDARDPEVQLGMEYLKTEPLKEYEEAKTKEKEVSAKEGKDGKDGKKGGDESAKGETEIEGDQMPEDPNAGMGVGMMGGMPMMGEGGRRGANAKVPEVKYEPTVWGRYAKVLLSSTEFTFIN